MKRPLIALAALALSACGSAQAAHVDGPPAALRPLTVCPAGSTVVVVGDSIAAIAADRLDVELRLADYVPAINASGGRNIGNGIEAVLGYTYQTTSHRCWVIALGTNDVGMSTNWQATMKDLLSRLPAGDQLWWMRVAVPGGDTINDAVPEPIVTLIDWQPTAGELYDGVHPTDDGAARWALTVLDALTQPVG